MVEELFRQDAYLKEADATVTAVEERGVRLDRSDLLSDRRRSARRYRRAALGRRRGEDRRHSEGRRWRRAARSGAGRAAAPGRHPGPCRARLGPALRHMRMHTALHVMSAVIKGNVTGGQVGADKSRLDFNLDGRGADQGMGDRGDQQAARGRPSGRAAMDHRRGARCAARAGEDHERAPADGRRPRAAAGDRRRRPAGLRRHACRAHGRDRPRRMHQDREQGQDEPPLHHRPGL